MAANKQTIGCQDGEHRKSFESGSDCSPFIQKEGKRVCMAENEVLRRRVVPEDEGHQWKKLDPTVLKQISVYFSLRCSVKKIREYAQDNGQIDNT